MCREVGALTCRCSLVAKTPNKTLWDFHAAFTKSSSPSRPKRVSESVCLGKSTKSKSASLLTLKSSFLRASTAVLAVFTPKQPKPSSPTRLGSDAPLAGRRARGPANPYQMELNCEQNCSITPQIGRPSLSAWLSDEATGKKLQE